MSSQWKGGGAPRFDSPRICSLGARGRWTKTGGKVFGHEKVITTPAVVDREGGILRTWPLCPLEGNHHHEERQSQNISLPGWEIQFIELWQNISEGGGGRGTWSHNQVRNALRAFPVSLNGGQNVDGRRTPFLGISGGEKGDRAAPIADGKHQTFRPHVPPLKEGYPADSIADLCLGRKISSWPIVV